MTEAEFGAYDGAERAAEGGAGKGGEVGLAVGFEFEGPFLPPDVVQDPEGRLGSYLHEWTMIS